MKKVVFISLCAVFVWMTAECGVASADGVGLQLSKNRYTTRRLSHKQYRGSGYSPVKVQPRRFTQQRNLGKLTGYSLAPKPTRTTSRVRTRLAVKGATTIRRAANRRELKRRRESRSARNRTVRGGAGIRN